VLDIQQNKLLYMCNPIKFHPCKTRLKFLLEIQNFCFIQWNTFELLRLRIFEKIFSLSKHLGICFVTSNKLLQFSLKNGL
jgi:hypothetical protein